MQHMYQLPEEAPGSLNDLPFVGVSTRYGLYGDAAEYTDLVKSASGVSFIFWRVRKGGRFFHAWRRYPLTLTVIRGWGKIRVGEGIRDYRPASVFEVEADEKHGIYEAFADTLVLQFQPWI